MEVTDTSLIRLNFISTFKFKSDILSILPTDILFLLPPATVHRPYLRFNRLLRVTSLMNFLGQSETRTGRPLLRRIVNLLVYILVAIHWNACLYILLSQWIGFASDGWVYTNAQGDYGVNGLANRYNILACVISCHTTKSLSSCLLKEAVVIIQERYAGLTPRCSLIII